jgi:hypothetical protein
MATYKRRQGTDGSQMFVMFPGELRLVDEPVYGESSGWGAMRPRTVSHTGFHQIDGQGTS